MADPFTGEIRMLPYTFAPYNWAYCDGQIVPIAQSSALFSVIGTIYGGDGRTTFGLPSLKDRSPMGWGDGPGLTHRAIGQATGDSTVSLVQSQIPSHDHIAKAVQDIPNSGEPVANSWPSLIWQDKGDGTHEYALAFVTPQEGITAMADQAMAVAGESHGHENRQPYLAVYFFICVDGIYPSRSS